MNTKDLYQTVTDKIIAHLENHLEQWNCLWIMLGQDGKPVSNAVTKAAYKGINQFLLSLSLLERGYLKNQ